LWSLLAHGPKTMFGQILYIYIYSMTHGHHTCWNKMKKWRKKKWKENDEKKKKNPKPIIIIIIIYKILS
jgi:hypothetical protein